MLLASALRPRVATLTIPEVLLGAREKRARWECGFAVFTFRIHYWYALAITHDSSGSTVNNRQTIVANA